MDLQFNYSIDGSITVRLDEVNIGYINYHDENIVQVGLDLNGDYRKEYYSTVDEAKEDIDYLVASHYEGL